MLLHNSQIVAAVFTAIYTFLSLLIIVLFEHKQNRHALFSLLGTIVLGYGFLIFRLMRGLRTKMVKYLHFAITLAAIILLIFSFITIYTKRKEVGEIKYDDIHILPGHVIYVSVVIQFILAIFLFTYLYQSRSARHCFAPFHDIFGIWIYICLVGCFLAGHLSADKNFSVKESSGITAITTIINKISYINFLIVIGITLSPYFEWELVGDI